MINWIKNKYKEIVPHTPNMKDIEKKMADMIYIPRHLSDEEKREWLVREGHVKGEEMTDKTDCRKCKFEPDWGICTLGSKWELDYNIREGEMIGKCRYPRPMLAGNPTIVTCESFLFKRDSNGDYVLGKDAVLIGSDCPCFEDKEK